MDETSDLFAAAQRLKDAVEELTDALVDPASTPADVSGRDWDVLRSLARYADVAERPENPPVLTWVPPLLEIEEGDRGSGKVLHFASWVFAITDERHAVAIGNQRVAGSLDGSGPVTSASEAVGALFDREMDWPDPIAYEQMGLDLELVRHSTHTMLAD